MKKLNLLGIIILTSALMFTGCQSENKEASTHEHMETEEAVYCCSMKCEGDRTYTEAGQCPVCGMNLEVRE